MKLKVSISDAIKKAEALAKELKEKEKQGKAYGFSQARERNVIELKKFRASLKNNKNNPNYLCKDMSGYIDVLQNALFHARSIVTDKKIRKRLDKVYEELSILYYLLDDIEIVP